MNNDRGLLSGSITILIGAVIAIMALVRGPWQIWLLLGVFTLWGLWVVLILLLPYMQQPDIDGGLIGGAALKPADFVEIINAANQD